jgi:hypothetical protein
MILFYEAFSGNFLIIRVFATLLEKNGAEWMLNVEGE